MGLEQNQNRSRIKMWNRVVMASVPPKTRLSLGVPGSGKDRVKSC